MAITHSLGLKNQSLGSGLKTAFDSDGRINIYTGSKPTTPDDAATGTLLGTLSLAATSFGTASGGVLTAAAIGSDTSADNSGTAGWFRIYKNADDPSGASGTSGTSTAHRRMDGTCGQGSGDMNFDNNVIVAGGTIACSSLTITHPS